MKKQEIITLIINFRAVPLSYFQKWDPVHTLRCIVKTN